MTGPLTPEIVRCVLGRYAVGSPRAVRDGGGTANANAAVDTASGRWFLKRRSPRYASPEQLAWDHRFMEHLAPFDLGTPLTLRPRGADCRWLEWEGAVFELYPFQPGAPHAPESLAQIRAAGERLAAFHRAGASFTPPAGKEWPRYQDPAVLQQGLKELDADLRANMTPDDAAYLCAQVREIADAYPDARYRSLPQTIVHGDYHPGNLLFCGDDVSGVFDLDWASRQPRVLDLADGVFLFAGERRTPIDPGDIVSLTQTWTPSPKRARAFLAGYLSKESVTDEEWAILPWAVRARWISCRFEGRRKLPPERQVGYVTDGLLEPLRALDALPEGWFRPGGQPAGEATRA